MNTPITLLVFLTLFLVGCGKNEEDTLTSTSPKNSVVETQLPAASDPLPANSLESEMIRSIEDESIIDVKLKASK